MPNLLALLREANPAASVLTEQNVTFGDPVAFNDPTGINNTKITVTAIKNKGYSGSVTIAYKRVTLDQTYPLMSTVQSVAKTDTVNSVTTRLTTALGALANELVLNNGAAITLPSMSNLTVQTPLAAKALSKLFLPTTSKTISLKMTLPIVEVTYSGNGNNLNTLTLLNNPTAIADYRLTVTGNVGSTSVANPALTVGALPAGSTMTLIVKGTVQGMGGAGGNYNSAGGVGGPAIKALMNFSLDTSVGKVLGGGGGGGGCQQVFGLLNVNWLRSAGGGGAGNAVGPAGTGTALAGLGLQTNQSATAGTATVGGLGAKTSSMTDATQNSQAGSGGAPGAVGSSGIASKGTSTATVTNYPGGNPGKAIDLSGFTVTYIAGNNTTQIKGQVA